MNRISSREEQLFADALTRPVAQRGEFLDTACGGDRELRQRLEALLIAHEAPEAVLPLPFAPGFTAFADEASGTVIGRYTLRRKIGEGGCGTVWLAEQEEPVRRQVALKVIKAGMDTREVITRFNAERQALAIMDHPGIAKVLDAGETPTRRPFFVMELVRGVRITQYCDEQKLSLAARLDLFMQLCHAVQHAHQKGVIHRDLKPSNILVTLPENAGAGQVKVIDFGIAKATQGRLADGTVVTAFEQFLGTPAYMSPEQADTSGLDIDTRSDVYSLGVLLYELLTGGPPFDPKSLNELSRDAIRRLIRDVDPPRPSARLASLPVEERVRLARLRDTDPARLLPRLSGDLDWIVMKAIEKDRTRRYDTPTAFASDIAHYLHHEPVTARPPSTTYRVGKLIRRNRLAFAAGTAMALTLVAATAVSTWHAVRATQAERNANAERERAEDLLDFMLGELRAEVKKVGKLDLLQMVADKATAYFAPLRVEERDDRRLAAQAKLLTQIGELRMDQSRYAEAQQAFAAAHGRLARLTARDPRKAEALYLRGQAEWGSGFVHYRRGDYRGAREWFVRYRDTAASLLALNPSSERWQRELIDGEHNLAMLEIDDGRLEIARESFEREMTALQRLVEARPGDVALRTQLADVVSYLGTIAERRGELSRAASQYAEQVVRLEAIVHAHPEDDYTRFKLGDALVFHAGVLGVNGQRARALQQLARARELLAPLAEKDGTNRRWRLGYLVLQLKEAMLDRTTGGMERALKLVEQTRADLERLTSAEPSDRKYLARLAMASRLEAALRHDLGDATAVAAALQAMRCGERLMTEGRATAADRGEYAQACIIAGRIAAAGGDGARARENWLRGRAALGPDLAATSDWQVLDPAVRIARLLGELASADALAPKLEAMGYTPSEPWPASDR